MRDYGKNTRRYASGGSVQIAPWYEYSREEDKKADREGRQQYDKQIEDELPIGRNKNIVQDPEEEPEDPDPATEDRDA